MEIELVNSLAPQSAAEEGLSFVDVGVGVVESGLNLS